MYARRARGGRRARRGGGRRARRVAAADRHLLQPDLARRRAGHARCTRCRSRTTWRRSQRQVRTTFLTARAAARRMIAQGDGGVILFFGGEGDPPRGFHLGALQTGFQAVEAIRRQLAVELGEYGIRTVSRCAPAACRSRSRGLRGARRDRREHRRVDAHRSRGDARGRRPRRGVRRLRPRADDDGRRRSTSARVRCSTKYESGVMPSDAVAARDEWELPAEPASVSFIRGQVKAFAQEHGVARRGGRRPHAGRHRGGDQLRPARLHRS